MVRDVITSPKGIPGNLGNYVLQPDWTRPSLLPLVSIRHLVRGLFREDFILIGKKPVFIPYGYSRNEIAFFISALTQLEQEYSRPVELLEIEYAGSYHAYYARQYGDKTVRLSRINGNTAVFTILDEGRAVAEIPVITHVRIPVLVTTVYVSKGDVLIRENTTLEFMEKNRLTRGKPVSFLDPEQNTALRNIPLGVPVMEEYLSAKLIVTRGETVSIILKKNNIRLEVQGIALESGGTGQGIRVRPLQGMKNIMATVNRKGEVLVDAP